MAPHRSSTASLAISHHVVLLFLLVNLIKWTMAGYRGEAEKGKEAGTHLGRIQRMQIEDSNEDYIARVSKRRRRQTYTMLDEWNC